MLMLSYFLFRDDIVYSDFYRIINVAITMMVLLLLLSLCLYLLLLSFYNDY